MIDAGISIGRVNSSFEEDSIHLELKDNTSGLLIFSGKMSLENFSKCITGYANVKIETRHIINKGDFLNVGKKRLTKNIEVKNIPIDKKYTKDRNFICEQIIDQYREDILNGWSIYDEGLHRQQFGNNWNATLIKYIEE
jgi:hypothetical protein